jgi:hypothetical protein
VIIFLAVQLDCRFGDAERVDALLDDRLGLDGRLAADALSRRPLQVEDDRRRIGARRGGPV